MFIEPLKRLLHSRKFLLALVGIIVMALQDAIGLSLEMAMNIEGLLIAVILGITVEDSAEKFRK